MLKINGKEYGLKFGFTFAERLTKDYSTDDAEGFRRLIGQIVDGDPKALVAAYRYALDGPTKQLPSARDVANALEANGMFGKGDEAFKDLCDEMKKSGFFQMNLTYYLNSVKSQVKNAKEALSAILNKDDKQAAEVSLRQAEAMEKELKTRLKKLGL
ncbi:hypothetical protein DN440_01085 [Lactobacillus reuteri]|uniref:tail assembly chaperone n=1 Tax=Limosilactobacillus reuteri TaxID=1598 RepID=UPI00128BC6A0|nr:tail assembly chaperone [Limosilactobacillus reuteri]MQB94425.1 hypothetical protein [Limosilactobacillus reuteri]